MKTINISLKKIVRNILVLVLISYLILSLYQLIKLKTENLQLTQQLEIEKKRTDDFYGQIEELSFIVKNACSEINKYDIHNAISVYTEMRHEKLEKDSISYPDVPGIDPKQTNVIYGYHRELVFYFDTHGKLKRVKYPKYAPFFRRID